MRVQHRAYGAHSGPTPWNNGVWVQDAARRDLRLPGAPVCEQYYTAVFLIVAYIAGYVVLYGQGYKAEAEIVGTVRLQLQRPTPEYRLTAAELGYCGNGTYDGPDGGTYVQHACRFMDQYDAVYPALEASATLLTTRATVTPQHLPPSCPHNSKANCAYANGSSFSYYVGDAEFFTVGPLPSSERKARCRRTHTALAMAVVDRPYHVGPHA